MSVADRIPPTHSSTLFQVPREASKLAHVVNPLRCAPRSETLIDTLEQNAAGGGMYVTFLDYKNQPHPVTYREALEGAHRYARYLRNRGLRPDGKVIMLLPTGKDYLFAFHGVQLAGGVPVPCAPPYMLGDTDKYLSHLRHIVRNSEAEFFVTETRYKSVVGSMVGDDNRLKHVVLAPEVVDEPALNPMLPSLSGDQTALLQYTSGTTSVPRGVVLTHRNLLSNVYGIGTALEASSADVGIGWLPLYHDMGLIGVLFTGLIWAFPLYLMRPEAFALRPHWWLENITRYRVSISPAPNFAYNTCTQRVTDAQLAKLDLSSWRVALNGAEPVDHRTVEEFKQRFGAVGFPTGALLPVYGMAENSLAATFPDRASPYVVECLDREALEQQGRARPSTNGARFPYHAVSVGYPLAGQEVAIRGDDGSIVEEGRVGEILVRSPSMTSGYYHQEEESARVLRDGWLHTGDLGYILGRRLSVTGRRKELIIKRGRNYYPYDIERVAATISGVRKGCVAAFACYNQAAGTEDLVVVAEMQEEDGRENARIESEINGELLACLGVGADRIVLVPPRTIPKTSSGKIQRVSCRDRYLRGQLTAEGSEPVSQSDGMTTLQP